MSFFRGNSNSNVWFWLLTCTVLVSHPSASDAQDDVEVNFGFQENDWSDPETLEFTTVFLDEPGNSWGNEDQTDFYLESGATADSVDAFIPGTQFVRDEDIIVLEFDSHYLDAGSNHSYLAFGSDRDLDNSVWFGHGGGQFYAGTGAEFSIPGSLPTGVEIATSFDGSAADGLTSGSRIGVRLGIDVAARELRNLQVDHNNDGDYDHDFVDTGQGVELSGLSPVDWTLLVYAGKGTSRVDNVVARQQPSLGDYNFDLDYDELDANVLCRDGVGGGDIAFDYNGDGQVDREDVNEFAFDNGSLPTDLDFNGSVEFADFLVFSNQFGQPAVYSEGDITCDGRADFADFLLLSTFFGSSASPQQAEVHAVPEPSTNWNLAIILGSLIVAVRRK